jgi:hypothetical protein
MAHNVWLMQSFLLRYWFGVVAAVLRLKSRFEFIAHMVSEDLALHCKLVCVLSLPAQTSGAISDCRVRVEGVGLMPGMLC